MSGSNPQPADFKGLLDDVQSCIGALSGKLSQLSEEHEREVSRERSRLSEEHEREFSRLRRDDQLGPQKPSPPLAAYCCAKENTLNSEQVSDLIRQNSETQFSSEHNIDDSFQKASSPRAAALEQPAYTTVCDVDTQDSTPRAKQQKRSSPDSPRVLHTGTEGGFVSEARYSILSRASTINDGNAVERHISLDPVRESSTAKSRRRLFFSLASQKTKATQGQPTPRGSDTSSRNSNASKASVCNSRASKASVRSASVRSASSRGEMVRFRFSDSVALNSRELPMTDQDSSPRKDESGDNSAGLTDMGSPLFEVLSVWKADQDVKVLPMLRSRSWKQVDTEDQIEIEDDEEDEASSCLDRFVLPPNSTRRLLWDLLGMLMIGYDLIYIPLQAFDPEPTTITDFLSWFTTCYWTLDIPFSFLVGFHTKGVIEMRAKKIAPKYVKGWFAFDVSVVSVDWAMSTVLSTGDQQVRASLRFLRMIRLLRLIKVAGLLNDMMKRIKSESLLIMLGIVKLIIFIMSVNHLIACGFYWIGEKSEVLFEENWIQQNLVDASLGYKYTTSLHWSLTQFTPASMEVVPRNSFERTYNVITLIFAMVTFSSFVSSITNAMTRLRNLNSERMEQHSVLRQYLVQNSISANLTTSIYGFLEKSIDNKSKRIHAADIILMRRLPKSLQDSLQREVFTPIITVHPFFNCFNQVYPKGMSRLYRFALEEGSVSSGQELFTMGEAADRMHIIIKGMLSYTLGVMGEGYDSSSTVKMNTWLCEQALWIEWRHCGQLVAVQHSEVLDVKASKFQSIVRRELVGVSEPSHYAHLFAEYADYLARRKRLTDICQDCQAIEEIANEAWCQALMNRNSVENLQRESSLRQRSLSMIKGFKHRLESFRQSVTNGRLSKVDRQTAVRESVLRG